MDFIPEIVGGEEEEVAPMPDTLDFEPKEKTDLSEDDVFDVVEETYEKPKEIKMKVVKEEPIIPETKDEGGLDVEVGYEPQPPKPKPEEVKPKRRRRGPMTEKQKKALAEGRAKALETRRKNAELRKQEKEMNKQLKEMELDKKATEIKQWKEKKTTPLEEKEVVVKPKVDFAKSPKTSRSFTQDEVDEITFKAIQNYDSVRKARKVEKQKQKKIDEEKARETERLRNIVHRAKPESKVFSLSDIW